MERVTRVELVTHPWEGRVLPLNYTRLNSEILPERLKILHIYGIIHRFITDLSQNKNFCL